MNRHLAILVAALLICAMRIAWAAPDIPAAPTQWVTDNVGFLSAQVRSELNDRLAAYEQETGHQIIVWVGKTTGDTPLEDWTVRAFQAWRIGRKGLDDGIVLFLFSDDRTARIEVGYGLEGRVPDAVASRILRETVIPRIQSGDHDGAVTGGIECLKAAIDTGFAAAATATSQSPNLSPIQILGLTVLAIALIIVMIRYPRLAFFIFSIVTRGGGGFGGGGFGGGGGRSGGGGASGRW